VKLRWEDETLVAELEGERAGEAVLRVEPPYAWVERLHAERPGVADELYSTASERAGELERELARQAAAETVGRVYVQTDDEAAVGRAVRLFVPRLGRSERTAITGTGTGWVEIDDELCSREPSLLRRLARELSDRTGAVVVALGVEQGAVVRYIIFESGRVADEYASVPEFLGPLPPGDVVALGANPTVAARLTGADPGRVRAVARTAASPAELPPAVELAAQLAAVLGLGSEP
jgi:hypothetical protein